MPPAMDTQTPLTTSTLTRTLMHMAVIGTLVQMAVMETSAQNLYASGCQCRTISTALTDCGM